MERRGATTKPANTSDEKTLRERKTMKRFSSRDRGTLSALDILARFDAKLLTVFKDSKSPERKKIIKDARVKAKETVDSLLGSIGIAEPVNVERAGSGSESENEEEAI